MTDKVKIIYNQSTATGFNRTDSQMLDEIDAEKIVKTGVAIYAVLPKPKAKAKKVEK